MNLSQMHEALTTPALNPNPAPKGSPTTYETIAHKGRDGWEAKTEIPLDGPHVLILNTWKGRRGLVSCVTRMTRDGHFLSTDLFGDYREDIITTPARCTEKAVLAQHNAALTKVDQMKANCAAHYAAKTEKTRQ